MGQERQLVLAYLAADVPVLLWGQPGTGKTAMVAALAKQRGATLETLIGSQLDPIDVGGYLLPRDNTVVSVAPPWAQRLRAALDAGQEAWLMLDELSCAPPPVQAALLRVVNERAVGELSIRGCRIIAATNPIDSAADGGDLAAATSNRWAHLDWTAEPSAWITGTLTGWGTALDKAEAEAASSICGWISRSPGALLTRTAASDSRAWPSPRAWTFAIRALSTAPAALSRAVVAGCVGEAAASEWHTYHTARDLPDAEDLLSGKAKLPKRGDQLTSALFCLVTSALLEHKDRDNRVHRAWKILAGTRPDCALSAAKVLLEATEEVPDEACALAARIRGAK